MMLDLVFCHCGPQELGSTRRHGGAKREPRIGRWYLYMLSVRIQSLSPVIW